MMQFRDTTGC